MKKKKLTGEHVTSLEKTGLLLYTLPCGAQGWLLGQSGIDLRSDAGIQTEAQGASKALRRGCIEFEVGQKD